MMVSVDAASFDAVKPPPVARPGRTVLDVRDDIRRSIIAGELKPGSPLSSAKLSASYGVSRTPIREALRLLQEEGFVTVESNQRPRVATWSPDELDAVFAQRVLLSAVCTSITVPRLSELQLVEIRGLLDVLDAAEAAGDQEAWREADIAFHESHTALAPAALRADLERLNTRALMFRYMWLGQRHSTMTLSFDDHDLIYEACVERDAVRAARAVAHHLSTVAITLLARVDPEREPVAVREAVRFVGSSFASRDFDATVLEKD